MRKIKILVIVSLLANMACQDPLDATRLDVISANVVWDDANLVDAYMADVFNRIDVVYQPEYGRVNNELYAETSLGAEGRFRGPANGYSDVGGSVNGSNTDHVMAYWRWQLMRVVNEAIARLSDENSGLTTEYREQRLGQAFFSRAIMYFQMVKRYGGVPIILEIQDVSLDPELLKVPRSTEKETYDQVLSDFNKAIALLEDKPLGGWEPNLDAAIAFKSRAALYAGSIAEFDDLLPMKKDGLVGISASNADNYYTQSLEASKLLMPAPFGTGTYQLRPGATSSEYRQIFDDIGSANDTESIMFQQFSGQGGITNSLDTHTLPRALPDHANWGAAENVYFETITWFDYKDGTEGEQLPDGSGTLEDNIGPNTFYDLKELFDARDPRFKASIGYPGMVYAGAPAYFHEAVTDPAAASAAGVPTSSPRQNRIQSALAAYKLANTATPVVASVQSNNPLMIMRLAEIYLNYAEAAFALGQTDNALDAVNAIRERVGMPLLSTITFDDIVNERKLELAFERHRYWDLKRWRIASDFLNQQYTGVQFTWDVAADTYSITRKTSTESVVRLFKPQDYYLPIPVDDIENNDVLIQNPGFEL
ncbi:RagB/SusD family nutrient uptake outer membrane protein [Arenibacter sp. S6351L]|uniref:RagB/SusD family nutrient uptake outer membrane protein n=1 Tax=Arenibacter sp. S6351L TaxID=2926407 RepID=UPI001FF33443|nr:RagB/SusD family nutrient uptake outer membrane protein [Arenibacter sp. S6351L]MCK0132935.1 RagB/SusD family nutrient uptake outer membrane protein [Arenibacter sp. S6351L]